MYKGIIHCHSTYSYDGKMPLSELKEFLKARGMSFACMTEHTDTLTKEAVEAFVSECRELSDETFVFVPGLEVPYKHAHILLIGSTTFVCQYAKDAASLRDAASRAQFVVLAHPVRNAFEVDDVMTEVIDALEIWNQQYEGKHIPRTRSVKLFDTLRIAKPALLATGGVDFHRKEHFGSPTISVSLPALSEEAILGVLKNGAYTFGTDATSVDATGTFTGRGSVQVRWKSGVSVVVITLGKKTNKILAKLGISLPKSLKQRIRRYI